MNWLARLFRRLRPDPLASLRAEPAPEVAHQLRLELAEQEIDDALRKGEHWLADWSNVAPGTHGALLHFLERRGLLECSVHHAPVGRMYRYTLTDEGRRYVAETDPA